MILQRYVEELQKKSFGKMDIRLLQVLGFKDAIRILTEERTKQLQQEDMINRRARLDDGLLRMADPDNRQLFGEIDVLGTGNYERS